MRLAKIKLAGFKSFVDPTTVHFPTNLVGVVGPNGCGKSNTIDAVRWVLGESSAKNLRGASMTDVIFKGSSKRKPVSQASVELVFDNTVGRKIEGQFAAYNEISVKRQVDKDGQSTYFLNNAKCRRRDISDLFSGTGLGPRSYAIIEQGMISRLIDAKPEELRVYIEEAAGISKYKERRKETLRRIASTRDNLERLADIREELERQLSRLQRQAEAARKYQEFKAEQRKLSSELLAMRWRELNDAYQNRDGLIKQGEIEHEKITADLRALEATAEVDRMARDTAQDQADKTQEAVYQCANDISRLEQEIHHQHNSEQRQQQELSRLDVAYATALEHLEEDQQRLAELDEIVQQIEPEFEELAEQGEMADEALWQAEERLLDYQNNQNDLKIRLNAPKQIIQVEQIRAQGLQQQQLTAQHRIEQLKQSGNEQQELLGEELELAQEQLEECSLLNIEAEDALNQAQLAYKRAQQQQNTEQAGLTEQQQQLQKLNAELMREQALQDAQLNSGEKALNSAIKQLNLGNSAKLAQKIQVDEYWQTAVELVLAELFDARQCAHHPSDINQLEDGSGLSLFIPNQDTPPAHSLAAKIQGGAPQFLHYIHLADDYVAALAKLSSLDKHESVICPQGLWLGHDWLKITRQGEQVSVLQREQNIQTLQKEQQQRQQQFDNIQAQLLNSEKKREQCEAALNNAQQTQQQYAQEQIHKQHQRDRAQHQCEQAKAEHEKNQQERTVLNEQLEELSMDIEAAQERIESANEEILELELQAESQGDLSEELAATVQNNKQLTSQLHQVRQEKRIQLETSRNEHKTLAAQLERLEGQCDTLKQQRHQLLSDGPSDNEAIEALRMLLEEQLGEKLMREEALIESREILMACDEKLREFDKNRSEIEKALETVRRSLEERRLSAQEIWVRRSTISEQFNETAEQYPDVIARLALDASPSLWESTINTIGERIRRLGAINLAAIEEYDEEAVRKRHLDAQNDDLVKALDTLEAAIAKIDRETRAKFKETFDLVNTSLQARFPKLFGGGQAYLELTDDDMLSTGITIMARPPGKRISTIQLMSGGEKAMTAIALVFSIFELNPAPFCMLDEVDAPLDEANVGRYCDVVKEMSDTVQFIFITHNKPTMELSTHLVGVTMREPGVSRIVAVDVAEALEMAE